MSNNPSRPPLPRRRLLTAGGTVGALAAAAAALPLVRPADPVPVAEPPAADDAAGGYRLSAHVQRYYQTAKV
jgi:hypothetical protein